MSVKTTIRLSEITIIESAAGRRSGLVLPLPNGRDASAPTTLKLLKRMLAAGLLEERRTTSPKATWRTDESGRHFVLRISECGRAAITAQAPPEPTPAFQAPELSSNPSDHDHPAVRGGKLGQVLSAVQGDQGASIGDLITLTGWQPHTVRASLTRLRQTGLQIQLQGVEGQRRYIAIQMSLPQER